MKIAYICDKKKKCAGTRGCGGELCNHTLDPNHALNGICEDPGMIRDLEKMATFGRR